MAFGNWPVATLHRRAVYKTEFDIFKQNTDIDLISLISYEEQEFGHLEVQNLEVRPQTVPTNLSRPKKAFYRNSEKINGAKVTKERNVLNGYEHSDKLKRPSCAPEREFRRNIWNKNINNTRSYKDFVKTSRHFLRKRQGDTEKRKVVEQTRNCKSALAIRKPLVNQRVKTPPRSQTTCGFRPNERHFIKSAKTNTTEVSHGVNTNNTTLQQKDRVNKPKSAWRTKSAPATSKDIDTFQQTSKHIAYTENEDENEDLFENYQLQETSEGVCLLKCLPEDSIWIENTDNERVEDNKIQQRINLKTPDDSGSELHTNDSRTERLEAYEEPREVESINFNIDVPHDNVYSEKIGTKDNCSADITSNETFTETVHEDCVKSRDSGFASNNVTPELCFSGKNTAAHRDFCEKHRQVTFKVETTIEKTDTDDENICISDKGDGKRASEKQTNSAGSISCYDFNTLISDLERFGATSKLSVLSAGCHSNYSVDGDNDSLCGDKAEKTLREDKEREEKTKIERENGKEKKDLEPFVMSREARHAILETLYDMGGMKNQGKKKPTDGDNIKHRSVNVQKRQKENRIKYDHFMRERTKSMLRNQFKSLDSVGNDDNSSVYSSPREVRDCDDESVEEQPKSKFFPSIRENTKLSKGTNNSTVTTELYHLENKKKKKYKIPGIGNYQLVESPESDFEITPPGFDSRYNARPVFSREEKEEVPHRLIREKSIEKCKIWLNNICMSPMALKPVKNLK